MSLSTLGSLYLFTFFLPLGSLYFFFFFLKEGIHYLYKTRWKAQMQNSISFMCDERKIYPKKKVKINSHVQI